MKNIRIFYYHTLDLTFKSAQTIQVIKDYHYLSDLGVNVSVYGSYKNVEDFLSVKEYIAGSNIEVIAKKYSLINRLKLKFNLFFDIYKTKSKKIIVTRHYQKLKIALKLKQYIPDIKIVHEMHEESFPYLFKEKLLKSDIKSLFLSEGLDYLIFTNYSQKEFFKKELGSLPRSFIILPNGVEIERFHNISMESNYVLTYAGGFNAWKNIDLIFEALSLLDRKFTLRIAGGKGNKNSNDYINYLITKYNIDQSRVNFLGFINNKDLPSKVLDKSNLLLIPLGDNFQSKYLTSPMKLFEYMSTKIPILAVNFPSISLITNDTIYLSSMKAEDFADKIVEICKQNVQDFDSSSMNKIAEKYSYKNRSLSLYKVIVNGIF